MCGIFAYIGHDNNSSLKTLRGLQDLEYRGYDSWGIAVKTPKGIAAKKGIGKISEIKEDVFQKVEGSISLGHTRWATHGKVSLANTHPHFNKKKTIAVVHNGIIENYLGLRDEIVAHFGKHTFLSETDTEVVPHLIDLYIGRGFSFEEAFMRATRRLKGRFAVAALHEAHPFILAVRNGSPLVVGTGEGEQFIASDTPAFLDYTDDVFFVENGEGAKVSADAVSFFNYQNGKHITKEQRKVQWKKEEASKGGWRHYMLKEIMEQKEALARALRQEEENFESICEIIKSSYPLYATACGTAGHVLMASEYFFSDVVGLPLHFVPAGEFHKSRPFLHKESALLVATQSGETADVLEAMGSVAEKGANIVSVLNVRGSSVERESNYFIPIHAGPEIAVASTKAATSQLIALMLLGYTLVHRFRKGKRVLENSARVLDEWLTARFAAHVQKIAKKISKNEHLYLIGKGVNYSAALEGALKIKEVSYIHAEGFASGELKHGPIALIEKKTPCVAFVSNDQFKDDVLGNVEELKARGAKIIGISPEHHSVFDEWIEVPDIGYATVLAHFIAGQLLAYYLSTARGIDPDKPRNLAKSVTVK